VLTGNRMGWTARCGRPPLLLPSCRKLEFRLSSLMDLDLAWVNGKSGRQSWCYADAFQRSIISEAIYHFTILEMVYHFTIWSNLLSLSIAMHVLSSGFTINKYPKLLKLIDTKCVRLHCTALWYKCLKSEPDQPCNTLVHHSVFVMPVLISSRAMKGPVSLSLKIT